MKITIFRVSLLFLIFLLGFACSDNHEKIRKLDYDCLDENLTLMEKALTEAEIGDEDGMYPQKAVDELNEALTELKVGISMKNGDMFALQTEVNSYCNAASSAYENFERTKVVTLLPGDAGELYVNGKDRESYIDFGTSPDYGKSSTFTVEAWLKYSKDSYDFAIADFIAAFDQKSGVYQGWMLNFMGSKFRLSVGLGPQSNKLLEGAGNMTPQNYDKWMHIVAVYDQTITPSQIRMYINSEIFFKKTNDVYDNGILQLYQPPSDYRMWAFQQPTDRNRCMSGYIKKFRLWSSVKTETEIGELMKTEVTGNEPDLICAWDFDIVPENSQDIKDKTGKHTAKIIGNYTWRPIEE